MSTRQRLEGMMSQSTDWTPPERPDPLKESWTILNEVDTDLRELRFEMALGKLAWLHENASIVRPLAVARWKQLVAMYPPAKPTLVDIRRKTEADFIEGRHDAQTFDYLADLNCALGQEHDTAAAFVLVELVDPTVAPNLFQTAQQSLVDDEDYDRCGRYLKPRNDLERIVHDYRSNQELERGFPLPPGYAQWQFIREVATLVALLVKNRRDDEAREVASLALEELNDQEFRDALDSALEGDVPKSW